MVKIGRLLDHPTTAGTLDYGRAAIDLSSVGSMPRAGVAGQVITMVDADAVGSVERVIAGARRLAAEGCLLILGPSVTDFAVPLIPVLDELQVPAINWSGSGLARGAWGFQLKVGSLPDEAGYLTRLIAAPWRSCEIALVRDGGPIGDEYAGFLRERARQRGRRGGGGCGACRCRRMPHDAPTRSRRPSRPASSTWVSGPMASRSAGRCARVARVVPVIGNIGLGVFPEPALEGVVFTDVIDDANPVLQRFAQQWHARFGPHPVLLGLAAAHDLAITAVEALRGAPTLTPAGVRTGLERLRGLPAAAGAVGTTIGFAPWDRDGYKGPLIVYRQIREGRAVMHRP